MVDTDLAWATDLFERRGKVIVCPDQHPPVQISIALRDTETVQRFASIVGVGGVYGPYRNHMRERTVSGDPIKSEYTRWCVADKAGIFRFAELLGPSLSSGKSKRLSPALNVAARISNSRVRVLPKAGARLSENQMQMLKEYLSRDDLSPRMRSRAELVYAWGLGQSAEQIAGWSGRHSSYIRNWVRSFILYGVNVFRRYPTSDAVVSPLTNLLN